MGGIVVDMYLGKCAKNTIFMRGGAEYAPSAICRVKVQLYVRLSDVLRLTCVKTFSIYTNKSVEFDNDEPEHSDHSDHNDSDDSDDAYDNLADVLALCSYCVDTCLFCDIFFHFSC